MAGTAGKTQNVTKVSHGLTATRKGEGSLGFGTNNPTLREYHEARRLTRKEEETMAVTALKVAGKQQHERKRGCRRWLFVTAVDGDKRSTGKTEWSCCCVCV